MANFTNLHKTLNNEICKYVGFVFDQITQRAVSVFCSEFNVE